MAKEKNFDNKILERQKELEKRYAELDNKSYPTYKTNCTLLINGNRYNLHVAKIKDLHEVLTFLINYFSASEAANNFLNTSYNSYQGYTQEEWTHDIEIRAERRRDSTLLTKYKEAMIKIGKRLSEEALTKAELDDVDALLNE